MSPIVAAFLMVFSMVVAIVWLPGLWLWLVATAKKPRKYSLASRHIGSKKGK